VVAVGAALHKVWREHGCIAPGTHGLRPAESGSTRSEQQLGVRFVTEARGRVSAETCCLSAIVLLGLGVSLNHGGYSPAALVLVVLASGLILIAPWATPGRGSRASWSVAVGLGAVASAIIHGGSPIFWVAILASGGLAIAVVLCPPRAVRGTAAAMAGLIVLGLLAGSSHWGRVSIDTFWFIQRASARLLNGLNPYGASWPTTTPGLARAHFTFGPGVLLLSLPARLLGDVRVSDLLAVLLLVALIVALARRNGGSEQGWRCLALCLTLPFLPFMINQSWAEIYLITAIAVWLWWRVRHPWAAVACLGLGLSTVPTAVPLLVLPFIWWSRPRREILMAALVAAAICIPFVVWAGPAHFFADVVGIEVRQPPRLDGLDFDAAWVRVTGTWLPGWVWPMATATILILYVGTRNRTWSSAFLLGAGVMAVSMVFAKWAFFNYYLLVAMGLILSVALALWVCPVHPARKPSPLEGKPVDTAGAPTVA